ncbi:hypothetical protein AN639_10805 [Candidatus Epulonipiscium fishelsonii]|uniref:Uncharacterized protein n=1 Tax=Candidatus Epulonipiscium fishelsonii TaxID=77094 RepID=A0ACC8XES4_9FIRM|nr:hypothetical protein AN396_02975 [Epulopiscium sp. SCG-B11WGA-EpuloA1]ONI43251.1 hypothetical protein AN639_10805 [Epulopiscium sp. SCG-B05WGA-EpuloA1]
MEHRNMNERRYDLLPKLLAKRKRVTPKSMTKLYDDEIWFDDYFSLKYIDDTTIAIGEPRYWQRNYSYLILGDSKALMFDAGSGENNIYKVARNLTDLPIIHMISHYHYDHIGSTDKFKKIYLAKNQTKFQQVSNDNIIVPKKTLGFLEKKNTPKIQFSKIVKNREFINLGNRKLQVLYSPGHNSESISLYDPMRKQLFAGDYLMRGVMPLTKSSMLQTSYAEFRWATKNLIKNVKFGTKIYVAHPVGFAAELNNKEYLGKIKFADQMELSQQDLVDLNAVINKYPRQSILPKKIKVNDNVKIIF